MTKVQGKYIFGVVAAGAAPPADRPGQFEVVKSGKFSAIVTDSEITGRKSVTGESGLQHRQILEELLAEGYTVIPVKPATLAGSSRDVAAMLERGNRVFQDILEKAADRLEFNLLAVWNDFQAVLKQLAETDEILGLRRELLHRAALITERDRIQILGLMKRALERKKARLVQCVNDRLLRSGQEVRAHKLSDDRLVFDTSFLLDKNRRKYFEEQVELLGREFGRELRFRLSGPLPGYSFYTLEIVPVDFEGFARNGKTVYAGNVFDVRPGTWPETMPDLAGFAAADQNFKTVADYCAAADFVPAVPEYYSPLRKASDNHSCVVKVRA